MKITDFGRKKMIERVEACRTMAELKHRIECFTDYTKRDPEVYAAILRQSRYLKGLESK